MTGAVVAGLVMAALLKGFDLALPLLLAGGVGASVDYLLYRSRHVRDGLHLLVVALSIGLAGSAGWTAILLDSEPHPKLPAAGDETSLSVEFPTPGSRARSKLSGMRGTVRGLRPGEVIWLMVRIAGRDDYFLMPRPCPVEANGRWTCDLVYLGPEAVDHRRYRILVRVLDGEALNQAIERRAVAAATHEDAMPCPIPFGRSGGSVVVQRSGPP